METRYSSDPKSYKRMTTGELRSLFLIDRLFQKDEITMIYSETDRAIVGSARPAAKNLRLVAEKKEMAAEYFLERREIGIINIGYDGIVEADGKSYQMRSSEALYIGRGVKSVEFKSQDSGKNAKYYFVSYPAHKEFPAVKIGYEDALKVTLGDHLGANKRTINKLIHEGSVKTCQLVMGVTELEPGSVWNTMPPHTHQRRSEIYMYYNLNDDDTIVHLMGEPGETRHIMLRNEQAVISPSWSIHSGVGIHAYSFIWAMGGENKEFDDMDGVRIPDIK
jgi:4-deoxy-L-threo-5-hexosulose-uronate ketol-isomerase